MSEEQKELAENYASNLTLFFGAASGTAMAINLSDEVLAYRPLVSEIAARYGMSDYVELILAVMMQESGGRGSDPMQASESGYNTRFPRGPGTITIRNTPLSAASSAPRRPAESRMHRADGPGPDQAGPPGYNYGSAYIDWAMERDGGYTKENAIAYSDMMCARPGWNYSIYGIRNVNFLSVGTAFW